MPDRNGRLTTEEIIECIREGEPVDLEFTHSHAGTVLQLTRRALVVDVGKREVVTDPDKARQIGEALIAWATFKEGTP